MDRTRNRGLGLLLAVVVAGLVAGCGEQKPDIEAAVKDNGITVYGTASKADRCWVRVKFTYGQDNARKDATHYCNECDIPVGKRTQLSEISDPIMVNPRVESVESACDSEHAEKPSWVK